jgi:hypothetical protein
MFQNCRVVRQDESVEKIRHGSKWEPVPQINDQIRIRRRKHMFVKKESKSIGIVWRDISVKDIRMGMNVGIEFWSLNDGGSKRWVKE